MEVVIFLVVVGSCIWVSCDAHNICRKRQLSEWIATRWFVACVLLWIVFFPMYLAHRNDEKGFLADWSFLKVFRIQIGPSLRPGTPKSPQPDPRKCPHCGYPNVAGWTSCFKCGAQRAVSSS